MEELANLGITVEEDRLKIFQEINPELDFAGGGTGTPIASSAFSGYVASF